MRTIALLATYNEHRFIDACLGHLAKQGINTYLIDNCSTDDTIERAERWRGRGLVGIESFPRGPGDTYDWRGLLVRKQELATELEADWFVHLDADELRLPPKRTGTLAEALVRVDDQGFNAVNFIEFTFMPTREEPDHDHADFMRTLRTYYPFLPEYPHQLADAWAGGTPHQLKAWKAAPDIDLASSGGHQVKFPGLKMYPEAFPMRHYLFLSVPHAIEKYIERRFNPAEVASGWHGWRARLTTTDILLPRQAELRIATPTAELDPSRPRRQHYIDGELTKKR